MNYDGAGRLVWIQLKGHWLKQAFEIDTPVKAKMGAWYVYLDVTIFDAGLVTRFHKPQFQKYFMANPQHRFNNFNAD